MKKTTLFTLILLLTGKLISAQVLFTENFDSYQTGHLNSNYDNTTPGQGWWITSLSIAGAGSAVVATESGKGKSLIITPSGTFPTLNIGFKQSNGTIATAWNHRTAGNILKFEFEFSGTDDFTAFGSITGQTNLISTGFESVTNLITGSYHYNPSTPKTIPLKDFNPAPFPKNTWIKVEMFVDFNTKNAYFYIPSLNIQSAGTISQLQLPNGMTFGVSSLKPTSIVKFDNIMMSALKTLPTYILNTAEQLAGKFNLYPNPARDILNISNTENLFVKQTEIYDLAGKVISTQNFSSEAEVQLNIADLASGTYMLYLETNQGTAVKKFIKK